MSSHETEPPIELAELQMAELDDGALDRLLADIELASELLEVRVKGAAKQHSSAANPIPQGAASSDALGSAPRLLRARLTTCRAELAARSIEGMQVVYAYRGQRWIDTVLRRASGYTLVRSAVPTLGE